MATKKGPKITGVKISEYLDEGQENAINGRVLANLTGLRLREVIAAVQRERKAGVPICADTKNGYFLPASMDEKETYCRQLQHRISELQEVEDACSKAEI